MAPSVAVVTAFVLYAGICVALGWLGLRQVKNGDDFLLAGKRLGSAFVIASLITAWTGAGSVVGGVSFAASSGLGYFWLAGDILGILLLVALAPTIRRVANFTTPEILEKRYGPSARLASSLVTFVAYTAIAGTQTLAGGTLLEVVLGPDAILGNTFLWGTLIFASVFILYTALGGLMGLAYVAVFQGTLMFGGLLALAFTGLFEVGGFAGLAAAIPPDRLAPLASVGWVAGLAPFLAVLLLLLADQSTWQRLVSSADEKTAGVSARGFLALVLLLHACFVMIGLLATALVPNAPVNQEAFQLVSLLFPDFIAAIIFVSFAAIVMSTASAYFLSASTNVVKDVYQRFLNPDATEAAIKLVSRLALIGVAVGAIALALTYKQAIQLALFSYYIYVSGIAVPLLAALFSRRATTTGAVASISAGFLVTVGWEIPWTGASFSDVTGYDPFLPALAASILALVVGSMLTKPPAAAKVDAFAPAPTQGLIRRRFTGMTLLGSAAFAGLAAYAALPSVIPLVLGLALAGALGVTGAGILQGTSPFFRGLAGIAARDPERVASPIRGSVTAWGGLAVAGGFFGFAHANGILGAVGFGAVGFALLALAFAWRQPEVEIVHSDIR